MSDILCRNFLTQLFEILLFCSIKTGCFVEYNAYYVLHFVTAIILRYTKNMYKICNCKPYPLKANFLANTLIYFRSNRSSFEKVIAKIQRGPDFMKHGVDN